MVEDNQIKAQVSPFAIREGEIKTFDGKDGYVSMNQIVHKINIGHINEIHFAILDLVNEFEFITSRQLFQLLEINGFEIKSQDKLNNKLDQLVKSKILTRYYFTSEEGKGIYRIYCLEKMGKYLLNSRGEECKWQPTDNTKPVAMIKKRLAGNQVIIAYLRKVKAFDSYVVKPTIQAKISGKTFKATGGSVKLTKNNKEIEKYSNNKKIIAIQNKVSIYSFSFLINKYILKKSANIYKIFNNKNYIDLLKKILEGKKLKINKLMKIKIKNIIK